MWAVQKNKRLIIYDSILYHPYLSIVIIWVILKV